MSYKPTLLLFGIGPRTGAFIASKFAGAGYQVAATGRSVKDGPVRDGYLNIKADVADPAVVPEVFEKVNKYFGAPPNVVVYNASSNTKPEGANLFSIPIPDFQRDLTVNITSLYAAGAEAMKGFTKLPENVAKTFIFVGNKQNNHFIAPVIVSLGMGKSAAAHLMESAAQMSGKLPHSCSFYYADERTAKGDPVFGDIDGNAHGEFFLQLAERKEQGPWEATFVKGKGYVKF